MMTTTRRSLLAGAAALPALSLPAVADSGADPILEIIRAHRENCLAWYAALNDESKLECLPAHLRRSEQIGCELIIVETDDPRWIEVQRRYRSVVDAMNEATEAMASVQPQTISGVLALLSYIEEFNAGGLRVGDCCSGSGEWPANGYGPDDDDDPFGFRVMRNIASALRSIGPNFAAA